MGEFFRVFDCVNCWTYEIRIGDQAFINRVPDYKNIDYFIMAEKGKLAQRDMKVL